MINLPVWKNTVAYMIKLNKQFENKRIVTWILHHFLWFADSGKYAKILFHFFCLSGFKKRIFFIYVNYP